MSLGGMFTSSRKGWIKFRYTNIGKKVMGRTWTVVKMSTEAKITVYKSVLLPKGKS